jgi:alkanesulfonate monooxygenase SsuD/methylene tetrahydromethanopterin reductase-like flavin-dependent oxidoreductase (luciferase family)
VTLRIAAKYANYTNFGGTPEVFSHKSELLRQHTIDVGTDFEAITRSANFNVVIADTEAEVKDRLAAIHARVLPYLGAERAAAFIGDYDGAPGVGTPEQIVERLTEMKSRGLAYAIHYFPEAAYDRAGIELFESQVIPALQ